MCDYCKECGCEDGKHEPWCPNHSIGLLDTIQQLEAENKRLQQDLEFNRALVKKLLPYPDRAVKIEAKAERLREALEKIAASTRLQDVHSDSCELCREARIAQQALKEE
jgi:cell shape-determining protein MreC